MDAVIFLLGGLIPTLIGAVVLGALAVVGGRAGSTLAIRGWTWNAAGLAVYGLAMLACVGLYLALGVADAAHW